MAEKRNPLFPNIPTLKEQTGIDWTMAAWRGIVAPKGLPRGYRPEADGGAEEGL